MVLNNRQRSALTWVLGKEIIVSFVIVLGLVSITTTISKIPFVYLPGYLIIQGSELIQSPLLPQFTGWAYLLFFSMYLYGIAIILGNIYRWIRSRHR
ncbi:hypothetical protein SAMN04487948_11088 [Halogranum amylolyticum]|uniref:Uncharacterized protein n=1 Tax=Halogranum amylolyticum TaxID=660520 RepID=A0A1H8UCJ0_9EURY|nr:hypothetical protein SAMN04487948_11088 [Halogranum amylolyticum]